MKVLEYLKTHGIAELVNEFNIKIKSYPEHNLVVLNYDQIESSKSEPIVMECRGLILSHDGNNWYVVSRSFDRFFNYGEQPDTQSHIDFSKAVLQEKIDGSLIRIYNYKGVWNIATRGTAFAESEVNGFDVTFKQLVFKALDVDCVPIHIREDAFQLICENSLNPNITYIFEITSMENRVVKRYSGYKLYFLAARVNKDCYSFVTEQEKGWAKKLGAWLPKQYYFNTIEECLETAKHLKDLDEGYVLYQDNIPVCKIKSPVYVLAHHLRGEGLNPKRIMQVILAGELDEYLIYFPEDEPMFKPYQNALEDLKVDMNKSWLESCMITDQKEFALKVKDFCYSGVMFQCKKNGTKPLETFEAQTELSKMRMLQHYMLDII